MACEDYPCCGHFDIVDGRRVCCCPDFDESGRQLNMICVCGAKLPINNPYSICDACLRQGEDFEDGDCESGDYGFGLCEHGYSLSRKGNAPDCPDCCSCDEADPGDMDGDHQSGLASAGWGTDEDYGGGCFDDFEG